ncbi:MAG: hypothetical protein NWE91_09690 [Candidatus Bathyarchaeota archaeon]|nr:hypothetical protein [Candidatus Bathyarchaeota archaeon]
MNVDDELYMRTRGRHYRLERERFYWGFHRQRLKLFNIGILVACSLIVLFSYLYNPDYFIVVLTFSLLTGLLTIDLHASLGNIARLLYRLNMQTSYLRERVLRPTMSRRADILSSLGIYEPDVYAAKLKEFRKTPKIFYYLDKSVVESLHNQIVSSIRTREITTESEVATSKGIELSFPIRPSYRSEKSGKEKIRAEVIESVEGKFEEVQNYLLNNELVQIGLEDFKYNKEAESEFLATSQEIKEKFDFQLPKNVTEQFININKKKYVDSKIEEVKSASGYILMSGEFRVSTKGKEWGVTYKHPVSSVIDSETGDQLVFEAFCPKIEMTTIGNDTFSKTDRVKMVLLANIVRFDGHKLELFMRPIAVYS